MLIRSRLGLAGVLTRVLRTPGGLWFPQFDHFVPKHRNILAVLGTPRGQLLVPASNMVTDAGDQHYAQRAVGETPTNDFTTHYLATAGTPGKTATFGSFTVVAATEKANAAGYPRTNDPDSDNTGAGPDIVTHLASYARADFAQTGISHGLISVAGASSGSPLLTGYAFAAPFDKTTNDTLKVFVNHEFLGV